MYSKEQKFLTIILLHFLLHSGFAQPKKISFAEFTIIPLHFQSVLLSLQREADEAIDKMINVPTNKLNEPSVLVEDSSDVMRTVH